MTNVSDGGLPATGCWKHSLSKGRLYLLSTLTGRPQPYWKRLYWSLASPILAAGRPSGSPTFRRLGLSVKCKSAVALPEPSGHGTVHGFRGVSRVQASAEVQVSAFDKIPVFSKIPLLNRGIESNFEIRRSTSDLPFLGASRVRLSGQSRHEQRVAFVAGNGRALSSKLPATGGSCTVQRVQYESVRKRG